MVRDLEIYVDVFAQKEVYRAFNSLDEVSGLPIFPLNTGGRRDLRNPLWPYGAYGMHTDTIQRGVFKGRSLWCLWSFLVGAVRFDPLL